MNQVLCSAPVEINREIRGYAAPSVFQRSHPIIGESHRGGTVRIRSREGSGSIRPFVASRMKLTGINQPWVADITYIRLKAEFVYLAVILDSYSRKVVGWALERTL